MADASKCDHLAVRTPGATGVRGQRALEAVPREPQQGRAGRRRDDGAVQGRGLRGSVVGCEQDPLAIRAERNLVNGERQAERPSHCPHLPSCSSVPQLRPSLSTRCEPLTVRAERHALGTSERCALMRDKRDGIARTAGTHIPDPIGPVLATGQQTLSVVAEEDD